MAVVEDDGRWDTLSVQLQPSNHDDKTIPIDRHEVYNIDATGFDTNLHKPVHQTNIMTEQLSSQHKLCDFGNDVLHPVCIQASTSDIGGVVQESTPIPQQMSTNCDDGVWEEVDPKTLTEQARREAERPNCRIFIHNIVRNPDVLTELCDLFRMYGEFQHVFSGIPDRGFLFITYLELHHAKLARANLNGHLFHGLNIGVRYALPRTIACKQPQHNGDIKEYSDHKISTTFVTLFILIHDSGSAHASDISTGDVMRYFSRRATVARVRNGRSIRPGVVSRIKFADFWRQQDALDVCVFANNSTLMGCRLEVRFAIPMAKTSLPHNDFQPIVPSIVYIPVYQHNPIVSSPPSPSNDKSVDGQMSLPKQGYLVCSTDSIQYAQWRQWHYWQTHVMPESFQSLPVTVDNSSSVDTN